MIRILPFQDHDAIFFRKRKELDHSRRENSAELDDDPMGQVFSYIIADLNGFYRVFVLLA